jgi:hypothetical protein
MIALATRRRAEPRISRAVFMPTTLGIPLARQNPDSRRIIPGKDHNAATGDSPIRTAEQVITTADTSAADRPAATQAGIVIEEVLGPEQTPDVRTLLSTGRTMMSLWHGNLR